MGAGGAVRACRRRRSRVRAVQPIRQLVCERLSLLSVVRLEVARGDLQSEVALAVLPLAEVAEQRQQRPDLAAGVGEVSSVDVLAALFGSELAHRPEVDAPI